MSNTHLENVGQKKAAGRNSNGIPADCTEGNKNAHLFHFSGANKAGMESVDKSRQAQVIYEMSKGSLFFKRQLEQDEKVNQKVILMKKKLLTLTATQKQLFIKSTAERVTEIEKTRSFDRICCVLDMDMFFAAVEIRDQPHLKELPVAVGGIGMISTTNYVARKYGVRSAMPGFIGKKLCPNLVFVKCHYEKYVLVSDQIKTIIKEYDPNFSSHSLDEVYMDLTDAALGRITRDRISGVKSPSSGSKTTDQDISKSSESVTLPQPASAESVTLLQLRQAACVVLQEIRYRIQGVTGGLTCSAGIANNFLLAKICADVNKPDGQFELQPTRKAVLDFVGALSPRKVGGVGKVLEKVLSSFELNTMDSVRNSMALIMFCFTQATAEFLLFSTLGISVGEGKPKYIIKHNNCGENEDENGLPNNSIKEEEFSRKSLGSERTFSLCCESYSEQKSKLIELCQKVGEELKAKNITGKTVTLKVKTVKFELLTRSITNINYFQDGEIISKLACQLLETVVPIKIRLIGVTISKLKLKETSATTSSSISNFFKSNSKPILAVSKKNAKSDDENCIDNNDDSNDNEDSHIMNSTTKVKSFTDSVANKASDGTEIERDVIQGGLDEYNMESVEYSEMHHTTENGDVYENEDGNDGHYNDNSNCIDDDDDDDDDYYLVSNMSNTVLNRHQEGSCKSIDDSKGSHGDYIRNDDSDGKCNNDNNNNPHTRLTNKECQVKELDSNALDGSIDKYDDGGGGSDVDVEIVSSNNSSKSPSLNQSSSSSSSSSFSPPPPHRHPLNGLLKSPTTTHPSSLSHSSCAFSHPPSSFPHPSSSSSSSSRPSSFLSTSSLSSSTSSSSTSLSSSSLSSSSSSSSSRVALTNTSIYSCPICNRKISGTLLTLNLHVDRCLLVGSSIPMNRIKCVSVSHEAKMRSGSGGVVCDVCDDRYDSDNYCDRDNDCIHDENGNGHDENYAKNNQIKTNCISDNEIKIKNETVVCERSSGSVSVDRNSNSNTCEGGKEDGDRKNAILLFSHCTCAPQQCVCVLDSTTGKKRKSCDGVITGIPYDGYTAEFKSSHTSTFEKLTTDSQLIELRKFANGGDEINGNCRHRSTSVRKNSFHVNSNSGNKNDHINNRKSHDGKSSLKNVNKITNFLFHSSR